MKIIKKPKEFFKENYVKGSKINVTETAKSLKVSRKTVYNWMNEINNS